MTNVLPSPANLFVYSNAATLLSSGLSNTDLENVIYCSTTTDTGPIQNFTATSLSSGIPYYMKTIYQALFTVCVVREPLSIFVCVLLFLLVLGMAGGI